LLIVAVFLGVNRSSSRLQITLCRAGDASYAIYLTHAFVMIGYAWLLKHTVSGTVSQVPILAVVLAACLLVGFAAHTMVEQPLLAMLRSSLASRKVRPA
jgi:peptidoglycan/LPS O-acetylase OafA/YrhL